MEGSQYPSNMTNSDVRLVDSQIQPRVEMQTLQRTHSEHEALVRNQRDLEDHNRDLQNINNYLRGEVADLRAQLSYATQTLTARIREEVDSARDTGVSQGRLRDVVDEQRRALQHFVRENKAATRRIQELQQGQSGAHTAPANRPRKTKGQRRREAREARQREAAERLADQIPPGPRNVEGRVAEQRQTQRQTTQNAPHPLPVAPTVPDETVKDEQGDSIMVLDDVEEERVPGLPLVENGNLNNDVVEQLTAIMKKRTGKKNLHAFLEHGARNKSFCIHEVTSKGKNASTPLLSTQPCRILGCNYTFRVKAVETGSGVKMKITHFKPAG
ncbi:hypothetical protein NW768_004059 [Fusarium equiseti]|uniref:Transposase n=1 Tax=Fusarium equiseti TaxID=61235 RepID=A0ABQ8RJD2_FUSEQ|nr:hypothetical protein NW768_004059 [Fusarium equiseti]